MRIHCPMCQKRLENVPDDFEPRPFCSPRCKLADLGNWLGETYRVSRPLDEHEMADLPQSTGDDDMYH